MDKNERASREMLKELRFLDDICRQIDILEDRLEDNERVAGRDEPDKNGNWYAGKRYEEKSDQIWKKLELLYERYGVVKKTIKKLKKKRNKWLYTPHSNTGK